MLGGCASILRDQFTKIYTRSHKLSFMHEHILQSPKAIHVNGYKSVEEPVKAKICPISSIYLLFANIKGTTTEPLCSLCYTCYLSKIIKMT